jgi:hypothetical protein
MRKINNPKSSLLKKAYRSTTLFVIFKHEKLNDTSVQEIISSFSAKYSLTQSEVMVVIETAFSTILSQWYRLEVMAFFRDDLCLEAVVYNNVNGVTEQGLVDISRMMELNTLKKYLEQNLAQTALLKQVTRYKSYEKELLWGEVTTCDREHNLYIETEIIPGEQVLAICPLNRIGLHERHTRRFMIGERRAFHLRQVEHVLLNGIPRLRIGVDRVSKTLVETLLRSHLGPEGEKVKIRCVKRYVGHKSLVLTTKRLPKAIIIAVDRELKERVEVEIVKTLP